MSFPLSSFLWTGGQYENIMQPNNVFEELEKDGFFVTAVGGVVVRLNEKAEEKQKPLGGIS